MVKAHDYVSIAGRLIFVIAACLPRPTKKALAGSPPLTDPWLSGTRPGRHHSHGRRTFARYSEYSLGKMRSKISSSRGEKIREKM